MRKNLIITGLFLLATSSVFAGGLLTNTNQTVHFLRNPARDASTEIDAVYTNPAGLTFLSNGFHISLNNQSAFQTRTITSTFAPFAANGGNTTKEFGGKTDAPVIPSLMMAYKKDRYAISGGFSVVGGGGKVAFNEGLPSFEAQLSTIPASISAKGIPTKYSVNTFMEGQQYIFGLQLNGSYKINDAFSAAIGVRFNLIDNAYKGYIKDFMINPSSATLNPTGGMMLPANFFVNSATAATGAANSMTPLISAGYGSTPISTLVAAGALTTAQVTQLRTGLGVDENTMNGMTPAQIQTGYNTAAATYTATAAIVADKTADKNLDSKQTGMGITPVVSLNYNSDRFNAAVKYEMKTSITLTNKTTIDDTGMYADGAKTPNDIPAYLALGADYKLTNNWKVSGGYHHFFDSDAKMANDKQKYINGGINEYLLGTEYAINKMFLISAGGQITRSGVTDNYQSDMSYSLNSYSVGFGGAVNLTPALRLNVAYFFTNYSDWKKESANYNGTTLAGTDIYARTNKVFGIGIDYKF